jgi:hypothetical protein
VNIFAKKFQEYARKKKSKDMKGRESLSLNFLRYLTVVGADLQQKNWLQLHANAFKGEASIKFSHRITGP